MLMLSLDQKATAEFRVGDLFDVGPTLGKKTYDLLFGSDVPYIAAKYTNNGVDRYVSRKGIEDWISSGNCMVFIQIGDGSAGRALYMPDDFVGMAGKTSIGRLKPGYGEMNRRIGLFIASYLTNKDGRYGYAEGWTGRKLRGTEIHLPVTDAGEPDWDWMEQYIQQIEQQHLAQIATHNARERRMLDALYGDRVDTEPVAHDYAEFRIGDVVHITRGRRVKSSDQIPGDIPYVTAATENNGIDSWIDNPIFVQEQVVTVSFFGDCYYHPYPVGYKDGTYGLQFKDSVAHNDGCYKYLASAVEKVTKNVGSYAKMLTAKIASDLLITLPVTPSGNIDFDFMEQYIAYIETRERNRRVVRAAQEQRVLSLLV